MTRLAGQVSGLPHGLAARVAALPPQQQERVQDALLAVALAGVNVVSVLPYRGQLHPAVARPGAACRPGNPARVAPALAGPGGDHR